MSPQFCAPELAVAMPVHNDAANIASFLWEWVACLKKIALNRRFGAWKNEVSSQNHSFMRGLEVAERILRGRPEITFADPIHANSKKHPFPFERWVK